MPIPKTLRKPFDRAIRSFAQKTEVVTKDRFLKLESSVRARSFTAARVQDLDVLADLNKSLLDSIAEGGTFRQWLDGVDDTMERRGWTGSDPWHTRLVYDMNVGMAYSAGRYDQARTNGIKHWRKLPSTSRNPRPEHAKFDGQVFPMDGPVGTPPWDFGCNCEWEVVFEDEFEGADVMEGKPPGTTGEEFKFHPRDFFQPTRLKLSDYPENLHDAIRRIAASDPQIEIA